MALRCRVCGGETRPVRGPDPRYVVDRAMNTATRMRCCKCGARENATEVWSSELAVLRGLAHLARVAGLDRPRPSDYLPPKAVRDPSEPERRKG